MKKILIFLFIINAGISANGQSFQLFNIDTTNFPRMSAKFFAYGADGNQIWNFSAFSDFEILEDGIERTVLSVDCLPFEEAKALSSLLTIDVSGSMSGAGLQNAKEAAKAWINGLPLGKSECAITSFNNTSYLLSDFTTDRNKLLQTIDALSASGGTDFDAAYWETMLSGLEVAKRGKYKRVMVFISDCNPKNEPQTQTIINLANQYDVEVYCVTLNMNAPQCLKDISENTGGQWYENVTTEDETRNIYLKILNIAQNVAPCEIEWQSGIKCKAGPTNVKTTLLKNGTESTLVYQSPGSAIARLEIDLVSMKIMDPPVGIKKDTIIIITARNAGFNITDITSTNAAFTIAPRSFSLGAGQSRSLTVSYLAADSCYAYTKFEFETDGCPKKYYASGGWPGKRATIRTLKLIHPNGGEVFVAGSDTVITWEGAPPDEPVTIEYRTDDSQPWVKLPNSATGLSYKFRIPGTASKKYLARATAKASCFEKIQICDQIWSQKNLGTEFYRNGEPIRHCETVAEWLDAGDKQEGAWCYYNNDPAFGEIYGKLYNWYAVSDPRGLAPEGWRVPTDDEWKELEMCLGMTQSVADETGYRGTDQGSKLAGRSDLWRDGNLENNTNFGIIGFFALPCGSRNYNGTFYSIGRFGHWWSSSESSASNAWYRHLHYNCANVYRGNYTKAHVFSVRCVID